MQKTIDLLKAIIIITYLLCSCTMKMRSGYYTISEIRGSNTVVLKEVSGDWHIDSASKLKVGQRIYLQRTKETNKVNVW